MAEDKRFHQQVSTAVRLIACLLYDSQRRNLRVYRVEVEYQGKPTRTGVVAQQQLGTGTLVLVPRARVLSTDVIAQKPHYNTIPPSYWPSNAAILTVYCIKEYFNSESELRPYFDLWDFQVDVPVLWPEVRASQHHKRFADIQTQEETNVVSPNPFVREKQIIHNEWQYLNRYLFQPDRGAS